MSKRSFDYKKKMNNKKKLHSKQVRKILMSSAVASTLVFQPFIPVIQNGQLIGFTENSASAATLAEVGLLTNEILTVNQDTNNPYNFSATLTGTGLASVELVDPETVAVFSAPDLAGDLRINGPATVTVQLLPITLNELPAVTSLLSGTIGTLTGVLDGILGGLGLVGGLDELNAALAALGNLDDALVEFTDYSANVPAIVNDDGTITVDFTEGLGDQLRPAVNNVVLQLLEDVEIAANSLTVLGLPIGSTVVAPLINALNSITTPILNGTTDLLSGLTTAQVLGQTTISVNASVDEATTAIGEIPVSGAVVGTSVIDAELLGSIAANGSTEGSIVLPAVDTEAPAAPTVTPVGEGATEVTGTAEPASTVSVVFPGGVPVTTTAGNDGAFTVGVPDGTELVVGDELSVTATDAANNTSPVTLVTVQDLIAPAVPEVNPVGDNATEITGTAEANSTVEVTFPGGITGTTTAGADGTFAVDVPEEIELAAGNQITVTATDAAENESDPATVIVTDETAPDAPVISLLDNIATEVTGTAEPGSIVTVTFPEGETVSTTADGEGNFLVAIPGEVELVVGDTVSAIATDAAGNNSDPGTIEVTEVDETAPDAPTVNDVGENDTEVTGTAEAGSAITVTLPGSETATGVTDEDGNFVVTLPEGTELVAGTDLEVTATDATGNESDPTIVTVGDETAPAAPTVNEVGDSATEVTGEAEAGSEITITLPNGETATGTTDEDGSFSVTLPAGTELTAGDELEVIATDEAGNASDPTIVTVTDTTAPILSPIDDATVIEGLPIDPIEVEVNESDIDLSGLPEGLVYDDETGLITGILSIDDWDVTEEERDLDVSVTAIDEAGNESEAEEFVLTIQRDTDGDGIPDIEDNDDDNDGVSDDDEEASETDPKDETDVPDDIDPDITAPVITEIDDITVVEGEEIEEIEVETDDEDSVVTVEGLPNGLSFDEATDTISGAPTIEDWGTTEEDREVGVNVTAMDHSGNESEAEVFAITIQRDTDGDGIPDIEDEDDDNDGYTDEEELEADTNPKDDTDFPDEIAPDVPVVNDVTSEDTTVDGTAEPGSEVIVTLPNGETVSGVTDEDGNFSITLPEDLDLTGGEVLEIVARDEAGNVSDPEFIRVTDRTAPIILEIEDQRIVEGTEIENVNIVVENPGEENQEPDLAAQGFANFAIQPFATPLAGVFVGNLPEGLVFASDVEEEEFVISGVPVISDWGETEEERDLDVTVIARDEAGNEATETFTITVLRDTDGDGIPDIDEDTTAPDAPTVEPVTDESTEVIGEAESNTDVTITLPNGETVTGRTDEDGNFTVTLPEDLELNVGDELSVVVTDEAGNVSEPTIVTVEDATPEEVDTTAPEAPTVEPVTDESTEVVGEAEPNTDVTITLPNGDTITGRTDEDGDFVIALPEDLELEVGDELTVVVTDEAGNSSEPLVVVVTDGSTSETPTDSGEDGTPTDGNNGTGGNGQGNGSSTGGGQSDDTAGGKDQESLPQTGESQSMLAVMSGSVMAAISTMMLAWNKRKKGSTKRK